jgi:hypothetical protein
MQVFAFLTLLGLATAQPNLQMVEKIGENQVSEALEGQEQEGPKKGLLSKAADVVSKSATATAAAAAMSRMADELDGKNSQSAGIVNPVSSIVKKHDKAQIAKLKQTGKISEGFPDLAFVHIPKTGGDAVSMASTPIFPYGFGLRANLALNLMVDKKKQGNNFCYFEQLPPKEIAKLYSKKVSEEAYGKRTVFCAVRNPYDRIVSEWHNCLEFNSNGRCSACTVDDMNSFVQKELTAFQKGDYLRGECQLIPQTDYTQGEGGCTKLLDFEHLERDFNELMHSHGYNLTLPEKQQKSKDMSKCSSQITTANLTVSSRKFIEKVYKQDFAELGPQFGWVEETPVEKVKKFLMAPFNALTSTYAQVGETTNSLFADLPAPDAGHRD